MEQTKIIYTFRNHRVKLAAHIYARQNNTSIQKMIEDAMVQKYPKVMKND